MTPLFPGAQASRLSLAGTSQASNSAKSQSYASPTTTKRMGAVVSALEDLLASIESEEKEEAQQYKCYVQWCDDTTAAKKQEIDENQVALENNGVAAEQHTSKL